MQLLQDRRRLFLLLNFVIFLIPVNVYMIGDWLGTGVQWILFRYQSTYLGDSIFNVGKDLMYVVNGDLGGKTSVAWTIWFIAAVILVLSLVVNLIGYLKDADGGRIAGILVLAGSVLLLSSDLIQYGALFTGPGGFCIPVGIPLLLGFGWLLASGSGTVSVRDWWSSVRSKSSKTKFG